MKVKPPATTDRPKPAPKSETPPKKQFAKSLEAQAPPPQQAMQNPQIERRVAETAAPAATTPTHKLAELASEIGAQIDASPTGAVTITFDAKSFDGLQVQLAREQGQLTVKLVSPAPEIANQLSANAENLRQRLEERGYRRAIVQVQRAPRAATPPREQKPWR
jgi:flagellar hook-length control protein FliK